jgi:hypothetical protein
MSHEANIGKEHAQTMRKLARYVVDMLYEAKYFDRLEWPDEMDEDVRVQIVEDLIHGLILRLICNKQGVYEHLKVMLVNNVVTLSYRFTRQQQNHYKRMMGTRHQPSIPHQHYSITPVHPIYSWCSLMQDVCSAEPFVQSRRAKKCAIAMGRGWGK